MKKYELPIFVLWIIQLMSKDKDFCKDEYIKISVNI